MRQSLALLYLYYYSYTSIEDKVLARKGGPEGPRYKGAHRA